MRKIGIALGIIILVIVVGALIFAATFDVNRYRGTIQSQLEKRLDRQVSLGDMHLRLFPPRFGVQDLAIADDPRFSPDAPFVKAKELDVAVKLLPLLHKQVEISSLDLQQPTVNLIKNQAGGWNFASIGHPPQIGNPQTQPMSEATKRPAEPPAANSIQPNPAPEQQFSLGELTIKDGQISLLDQTQSKTPSLYNHIDVTLKNFSLNTPFTIDAAAHMAGAGTEELRLQGEGGPIAEQDLTKTSFHGTLDIKQVEITDLTKFLNSPALNGTDGVMTGQIKITNDSGKMTAEGETNIQKGRVRGMELGYPISLQYDLTNDLSSDLIAIRKFILKLGPTPLEVSGTINVKPASPQIDLNLRANNVSVAEAAKFAAASGMALSQGTTATGTVNVNVQARGAAEKPALTGTMTASNIQLSGKEIPQPVQIQTINLHLTPADIRSDPFNVVSGGTTVNSQLTLRNYMSPSPIVDATLRAPNAQLPAILAMAKAYGVTALDKFNGEGTLKMDMHAAGPVKSISSDEIMKALNGNLNLNFANVKYSGVDIGHELSSIAGFLNSGAGAQSASGVTNILKMTGNIAVKNGIAQTSDLQAQLDMGNIGLVGTASLVTEALNMHATAVISQNVSQKVGGQSVGGFMKTALANNQGELVIPALVTGTFSKPKFEPDVQQMAQMKLKGLIPNINNPASVAGTLQNLLGGPKNPGEAPQQQAQQQQNPVQQILGLFGKKKQDNEQPK
ncbi:MAG TPA: AsmA family protein [Candidatus Sulfotelmatobacter sp.]|nr:AsmA family protein [Candidatus Sulfotelmatobacter sp.]